MRLTHGGKMINWEIIWTAVGAIGTSVGSLITAIAIVIAVIQYKQPYHKRIRISYAISLVVMTDYTLGDDDLISIQVSNIGIRNLNISNVYLKVDDKNIVLNDSQWGGTQSVVFPQLLHPEEHFEMHLLRSRIIYALNLGIEQNHIREKEKMYILVTDNSGGNYVKSIRCTVRGFIGN